ncbi:DUF1456 family protein [Saccharospirillum alexandrii]|uniref:DUF1456 family protein n=1 Tax=Saccharospirillum alexandrii TaxID=2448477 RepID=UPI000FDB0DD7|nr:DUF1456 family protein [Saccharospirillum alexandrii]
MTNNDVLRRIRYTFDLNDRTMVSIFALADCEVTQDQVVSWLKKEEDNEFLKLTDRELAVFLNGFINFKRGKRDGQQPEPESRINNNKIFQKLRIALNLKADDILGILQLVDLDLSQHELSAFFRNPESSNYRECKDQVLRNFLLGVQLQLRPGDAGSDPVAG